MLLAILFSIMVSAKGTPEYEIEPIVVHNPPELSLDIVFVPANFTWEEKDCFRELAKNLTNYLFSTEPFASYKEVINTWMCFTTYDFGVYKEGPLLLTSVDRQEILRLIKTWMQKQEVELDIHPWLWREKEMPDDQVVILVKDAIGGSGAPDLPIAGMKEVLPFYRRYVFLHELGHSFADLPDEHMGLPHRCIMAGTSDSEFCSDCTKKLVALLEKYSKPYNLTIFTSFPINPQVRIEIDSLSRKTLQIENGTLRTIVGKSFNISIEECYQLNEKERYVFKEWSDGINSSKREMQVNSNIVLRAIFIKQYFLNVTSLYSNVGGSGWYNEGEKARISIEPLEIEWGSLRIKRFKGWSIGSKEPSLEIVVDRPKSIIAEWEEDWNWPNIYFITLVLVLSSVAVLYYQSHQKNRRKRRDFLFLRAILRNFKV
jgi:hypothetical protein